MAEYQVTIGYKAVIVMTVQADSELDAREFAIDEFTKKKDKMYAGKGIELQDDNYKSDGVLNMDETWNMLP